MPIEIAGSLHLNIAESREFLSNMLHPNESALALRDAFLSGIDPKDVSIEGSTIIANCPNISLPANTEFNFYDQLHTLAYAQHEKKTAIRYIDQAEDSDYLFERVSTQHKSSQNIPNVTSITFCSSYYPKAS